MAEKFGIAPGVILKTLAGAGSVNWMADICVVHLVWKPLGPQPLRDFIASYKRNGGGVGHRLVVAFNGFGGESELGEWREMLKGVPHEWFLISPPVQDIPAYFEAARRLDCEYLCFVNSHSVILDPEWLEKLYEHARREGVGAVGATGSWSSHHSWILYEQQRPSVYADVISDLFVPKRAAPFALTERLTENIRAMPLPARLALEFYYYGFVATYYKLVNSARLFIERRKSARDYGPFPAYHLRTNAFLIRREVMLSLKRCEVLDKKDAYRFESGKESMTNQLLRLGLKVLVVGRDGRGYEKEEWPLSETFCQGEQRNLLVADNQTRDYDGGDAFRRMFLSRLAWGEKAAPSLPSGESRASA